jgi:hypothetical protein
VREKEILDCHVFSPFAQKKTKKKQIPEAGTL